VPAVDGHLSLVIDYKNALAKYFPGEAPDYVSLEGYVAANVLIAALKQNGPQLDTERLVATLEDLRDLDIGLGTPGGLQSIGASGRAQGVGYTARRDRALSTH
jgi:branched-chain amino acid transport system substrate-binding protein